MNGLPKFVIDLPSGSRAFGGFTSLGALQGLSRRELFAAMAMQGLIAGENTCIPGRADTAERAIQFADALIAALEKEEPPP